MAKINFKLKAMHSVTVRALNGKLYNLKSGVNSFELEYNDYAALLKALGMKPKPEKKDVKQAKASDSKELKDEELANDTYTAQSGETSVDEHINESEVSSDEHEVKEDESSDEITNEHETEQDSEVLGNEQEVKEDSKKSDYTSMSYTKLKAEYKRITGKQCKLKKDELIKFLQEHRDA